VGADARAAASDGLGCVTVRIRPAHEGDVAAVAAIERSAFSDPWSARSFASLVHEPQVLFAVAEGGAAGDGAPGGPIVGYVVAWYAADEAEIANVAVAAEARRSGVGAQLVAMAIAGARARGCRQMYLEVRESNGAARELYARHGFVEIARRPRYYRQPVEDAVVMRAEL
jgi:[ribosomal protein S18]-alanine N-acetyltransferase